MKKGIRSCIGVCLGLSMYCLFVGCKEAPHVHNYDTDWEKNVSSHWLRCVDCEDTTDLSLHVGGEATCTQRAVCSVCGEAYGEFALHTYDVEKRDGNYHWKICSCGAVDEASKELHTGGKVTCTEKAACEICGIEYGTLLKHAYVVENHDSTHHWNECVCGDIDTENKTLHSGGNATCEEKALCDICEKEYGKYGVHRYTITMQDEYCHWKICSCGDVDTNSVEKHYGGEATCKARAVCADCGTPYGGYADHTGGTATCTKQAGCEICATPYGEMLKHEYTVLKKEGGNHWYACVCGDVDTNSVEKHYGGEATCKAQAVCADCGTPYGGYADHIGGTATCAKQAVCEVCQNPYGSTLEHEYNVDNQNETQMWKECVCGKINESTIKELPVADEEQSGDDSIDGEAPVYVELEGYGTEDEPYVLTENCCVNLEVSSYNDEIYFFYEAAFDCVVSFTDTNNVDETAFEYGEDVYNLTCIDPAYVETQGWHTYYFVLRPQSAGEMTFAFTVK